MTTRREREEALQRYLDALDRGDLDTVEHVLARAQGDADLEQMILEVHAELDAGEEPGAADAAALVRAALDAHAPGAAARPARWWATWLPTFTWCGRALAAEVRAWWQGVRANVPRIRRPRLGEHGRRWVYASAGILGYALLCMTVYVHQIEVMMSQRQTLVLGQKELAWASPASFRVIALSDMDSKRPLRDAPVLIRARGAKGGHWHTLYEGRTNRLGTVDALFRLPADLEGPCVLQVATGKGQQLDRLEQGITVERRAKVLLSTDKPLYQPGQTIHLRALAMETGARRPAASQALTFEVKDPKGTCVFRKEKASSQWGIASTDFRLADEVNQGRYQVAVTLGDERTEKTVTVKPYVLPKFRVDAKAEKPYYLPGGTLRGRVSSAYFFGKPVAGGRAVVELAAFDTEFHPFARLQGRTDSGGAFAFEAKLPETFAGHPLERGDALVRLTAVVTDRAGHEERVVESVPVADQHIRVAVVPESGEPAWGLENTLYVVTSTPDGRPARTRGRVTADGREVPFETDETGIGAVTVTAGKERLEVRVDAEDTSGRRVSVTRSFVREWPLGEYVNNPRVLKDVGYRGAGVEDVVLLRPDRALYRVGDRLRADVLTRQAKGAVYFDIARDGQTLLTRSGESERGRCRFEIGLSEDLAGTLTLHAYYLTAEVGMVRDTRKVVVRPAEELQVAVKPSRESFRPGEEGRIGFELRDAAGKGVPGAIGVSLVDESVFALREADPALEHDTFAMEKAILEPRYQAKFALPPYLFPGSALREDAAQRRAAVALACLPGPKNHRLVPPPQARSLASRYQLDPGDTDYALWAESLPDRRAAARAFRERYLRGLKWLGLVVGCVALLIGAAKLARSPEGVGCLASIPVSVSILAILMVGSNGVLLGLPGILLGLSVMRAKRAWATGILGVIQALVLVAILLPCFSRAREQGRRSSLMSSLHQVDLAQRMQREDAKAVVVNGQGQARRPGEPPRLRQLFPETLFWAPEVIAGDDGRAEVTVPMADSITTWRLSALASDREGRLGSATHGVRVFQEFFIDLDLPLTLTQGDWIEIPVAVHNYLPKPQQVRVTLSRGDWLRLEGGATREVRVPAHDVGVVRFPITARRFGTHALTVTAESGALGDAIRREIEVVPAGRRVEQSAGDRLQGEARQTLTFPRGAIPGTQRALLKIHPAAFSQVVDGLEGMLAVPHGCFEQTSSITYPNILVLDYLKRTGRATPEVRMRAEQYVNLGYQRILTFETPGGGFDWFGTPPAKTAITAYGLMELHDMAKVAHVDAGLIERARKVLLDRQAADGSWSLDHMMETWSGIEGPLAVTAFTTWALAYTSTPGNGAEDAVARGLDYLAPRLTDASDPYVLALAANAFAAGRPDGAETRRLLDALDRRKTLADKAASWGTSMRTWTYGCGGTASVETTALAAQALLRAGRHADTASQALTYLVRTRDASGTWGSTQATILALQALLAASDGIVEKGDAVIRVHVDGKDAGEVRIDKSNADMMQQVDLTPYLRAGGESRVELSVEGDVRPAYQVVTSCWVPWGRGPGTGRGGDGETGGGEVGIRVAYDRTRLVRNGVLTANVTLRSRSKQALPMLIADVGLAPGFTPEDESLEALRRAGRIERYEVTPRQLILYLRGLPAGVELRLPVRLRARFPVRAVAPPSTVYEYYNPGNRGFAPATRFTVST